MLKYFQLKKNMKEIKDGLYKIKNELDKTKDDTREETKDELDTSKKSYDSHGFDINGKHKDTDDIYMILMVLI